MRETEINFYLGDALVTSVAGATVPRKGEFVNIAKITYKVGRVTWAVDYSDLPQPDRRLRASVELEAQQ